MTDPISSVIQDGVPVPKAGMRGYENARNIVRFADANAVRSNDLTSIFVIYVQTLRALFERRAGDMISADNGTSIIVDGGGNRWHRVAQPVVAVGASGPAGERTTYDNEADGFAFFDYDAFSGNGGIWFREGAAGNWEGPFPTTGPQGAPGSSDVVGTSTTSLAIEAAQKVFTIVESDRGWGVGARLRASSDASPETHFMEGVVTAYAGNSLTLQVDTAGDPGTRSDWTINLAGEPGAGGVIGNADRLFLQMAFGI